MPSPASRVYDAFSTTATEKTVTVGSGESAKLNMPIMIADHSVIYLPMKDENHYVVFSMADIFNGRKGINNSSIFNYQPVVTPAIEDKVKAAAELEVLKKHVDDDIKKIKAMDERIYENLIAKIKAHTRVRGDKTQLFSVKDTNTVETVFDKEEWHSKLTYNFADSFYDYGKAAEAEAEAKDAKAAAEAKEKKDTFKTYFYSKVKDFIAETINICKEEIKAVLKTVGHKYLKSKLNNIVKELEKNLTDDDLNAQVESVVNQIVSKETKDEGVIRGYYIFQPPGNLIKQQPFGGFVFTAELDDIYKSTVNFQGFLNKFRYDPTKTRVFATEVINCPTEIPINPGINGGGVNMFPKDTNQKNTKKGEYLWHGGSDGPKFTDLQTITKKTDFKILLSDTNMTEKKSTDKGHDGTFQDISKKLKEKVPGLYVLSSNFKIKKSRMGGPFYNTQIYKSERPPPPAPEIDGMVIIFSKDILLNVDIPALQQLIGGEKYYILHKDGVEVTSDDLVKESAEAGAADPAAARTYAEVAATDSEEKVSTQVDMLERKSATAKADAEKYTQQRPNPYGARERDKTSGNLAPMGGARRRRNRKSRKNKAKKSRKGRSRSGNSARKSRHGRGRGRGRGRRTRRN